MSKSILILCDERDVEIAGAARAAFAGRGHDVTVETCDAAAETLGTAAREKVARAAAVVVVVREGGRGNRLLRAVEDDPRAARVLSLTADAAPDLAVTARTEQRIHTLGETLSAALGEGRPRRRRWPFLVALLAVLAALALFAWLRFGRTEATPDGPPVILTGMQSNQGWMVTFHLREEAASLEYRREGDPEFVSTGQMGPGMGPAMDAPRAKPYAILPGLHGRVPFQVRYRTISGSDRGPYDVVFDTTAESVASARRVLADVPEWVSFRLFSGRRLCYFTTLLSYKYALRSIHYGVDGEIPDRNVHFTPRDAPGIDNDDQLLVDLPPDASAVTVEIVYLDGTSEKKRFPVRY